MVTQLKKITRVWPKIKDVFVVPHSEQEYKKLVGLVDNLVDEIGENESHPLASLLETLGSLVETYEAQHVPEMGGDPITTLKMLMKDHGLKQSDLKEISSQGVISEVLSGKRPLNLRHIKRLSERFNVSPSVFIGES
ncbi:MAG: helix-turn-helix domain-containing protein [Thermodesulfobacteriota bacterium]|nr:helix-turn-helix domain-containing protein [Thermodesulfobacteriota bacterium]